MHKNLVVHHWCAFCRSLKKIPFSHPFKVQIPGFSSHVTPSFFGQHTPPFFVFRWRFSDVSEKGELLDLKSACFFEASKKKWPVTGAPQQKAGFWTSPNSSQDVRCATFWKSWIFFPMGERWVGDFTTPPNSQKRLAAFRCFFFWWGNDFCLCGGECQMT